MLDGNTSNLHLLTQEGFYRICYDMVYSINPAFEEYELWEFGIHSVLYNENNDILSEAEVPHISPDKEFVSKLMNKLMTYKVFPIHLLDVVSDELDTVYA